MRHVIREEQAAMRLGYRHFVVIGDTVTPLSQKAFAEFYWDQSPVLQAFAGHHIVDIATVMYTVADRKPQWIVQIDGARCQIRADGALGLDYEHERTHLTHYRLARMLQRILPSPPAPRGTVIDARDRFDERRLVAKCASTLSRVATRTIVDRVLRELSHLRRLARPPQCRQRTTRGKAV